MSVREIMARIIRDETGEADEESGFVADAILAAFHVTLKQPVEQPGKCEHGTLLTHLCADCPRPMRPHEKVQAIREGRTPNDGYGRPLTQNARGEWVNEIGDTPCPSCGEMTNSRCWRCGWVRYAPQ